MTQPDFSAIDAADTDSLYRLIASVLMVPPEAVQPHVDLVYELGAESIDFLDLLFSLDELAGGRVLPEAWSAWQKQRLPDATDGSGITPSILAEFVAHQRATLAATSTAEGAA
jgi:acyl carrier protein